MKKNSRPTLQLISRISWCGCESVKRFSDGVNQSLNTSLNLLYYWSATIYANRHYLSIYHRTHGERLAVNAPEKPKIIGDVLIHPLAVVHPTATVSVYSTLWLYVTVIETDNFHFGNLRKSGKLKLVLKNVDKFLSSWRMDKFARQLTVATWTSLNWW